MYTARSAQLSQTTVDRQMRSKFWKDALQKFFNVRKGLHTDTFLGVNFSDRVRDPIGLVRELYRQLGQKLSSGVVGAIREQSIMES